MNDTPTDLLTLIREQVSHPATVRDLARILRIPPRDAPAFRRQLKALVKSGALVETRGNLIGLPDARDMVVGRLQAHPSGYGFVRPDGVPASASKADARADDVFIPPTAMGEAMHGDRVVAKMERRGAKGFEGRIVEVLERKHAQVVGSYETGRDGLGWVVPFDRRLGDAVHIPTGWSLSAEPDEMVVVELTGWPSASHPAVGRIREVLGKVEEPGVDTQVIIRSYGIPDAHGPEAIAEAVRLGGEVREVDLAGRTDFRAVTTVTIDGEHARDFDDAITIEKLPNGHYWLGVHIADVSHYVTEGSALDEEAYQRGTSVYFPERAVHMFPAELATGLCSLNPHVDRLVQSCLMEVDTRGQVVRHEIHDGVIHSAARMTYTSVAAIVTDRNAAVMAEYAPLVPMFDLMHELFQVLHQRRHRRGAIDFDLPEAEVLLTEFGEIEGIVATQRNVAHRIIEEFMLLANETVAEHLETSGVPGLYRVHEAPDMARVEDFEAFITTLGFSLAIDDGRIHPRHFQRLVERIQGTPEERPVAALMLRTMQRARYDESSLGHFGLAAQHYTHFTSPIRRYPDLVVHRCLREARQSVVPDGRREAVAEDMPEVARHTSEMERRADDAERALLQWKKVRFMADKVGDEFDGYVVGVVQFGLFVELIDHYVEGLVPVASMADDYYRFIEQQHVLRGEQTRKIYRLGDKVRVQVVRIDLERRQVELGLLEVLDNVRRAKRTSTVGKVASKQETRRTQRPGKRERQAGKAASVWGGVAKKGKSSAARVKRATKRRR